MQSNIATWDSMAPWQTRFHLDAKQESRIPAMWAPARRALLKSGEENIHKNRDACVCACRRLCACVCVCFFLCLLLACLLFCLFAIVGRTDWLTRLLVDQLIVGLIDLCLLAGGEEIEVITLKQKMPPAITCLFIADIQTGISSSVFRIGVSSFSFSNWRSLRSCVPSL